MVVLSAASTVSQSQECLAADVGAEMVLITLRNGVFVSLDELGAEIWKRLASPVTVAALRDQLTQEYDAGPDIIEADLIEMLTELSKAGTIEVSS